MKRELGFGRCGLACCLCSENDVCAGCDSGNCPDKDRCENRRCSAEKGLSGCFACAEVLQCTKGLLQKVKRVLLRCLSAAAAKRRCWMCSSKTKAAASFTTAAA